MSILSATSRTTGPADDSSAHWMSVSDLMSALMMVFLLLAVFYMIFSAEERKMLASDQNTLISKTESLETALVVSNNELTAKSVRLAETTEEYNKLLDKVTNIEGTLSGTQSQIGEKTRLLNEVTNNYRALMLQAQEKDKLLNDTMGRLQEAEKELAVQVDQKMQIFSNAVVYDDVIKELHQSLLVEFRDDLTKWNAELRDDMTFRFNEPSVLFDIGVSEIKPKFKAILDDFFPRYIKVITSEKFRQDIAEVRIEGHTSSIWADLPPDSQDAYFYNMQLSQDRSRSTLDYVMRLPVGRTNADWLKSRLIANGLSSSKLVDNNGYYLSDDRSNGVEDASRSQRVEFRVRIDAESKITKVIEAGT